MYTGPGSARLISGIVGAGMPGQTVRATGQPRPLEGDGVHDLREGQREHQEVHARSAHRQRADEQRAQTGDQDANGNAQQHVRGEADGGDACRIRAQAPEGRMPE